MAIRLTRHRCRDVGASEIVKNLLLSQGFIASLATLDPRQFAFDLERQRKAEKGSNEHHQCERGDIHHCVGDNDCAYDVAGDQEFQAQQNAGIPIYRAPIPARGRGRGGRGRGRGGR